MYFTPEIKGVSTSQHMSHSIIRLPCYLAVVCVVYPAHSACRAVPDPHDQIPFNKAMD